MSNAIGNGRLVGFKPTLTPVPTWNQFCRDWIRDNGDPGPGLEGLEVVNAAWMKKYPTQKARGMSGFYKARQDMGLSRKSNKKQTNGKQPHSSVGNFLLHAELIGEFFATFDKAQLELITRVFKEFTVEQMKNLEILCNRLKTTNRSRK